MKIKRWIAFALLVLIAGSRWLVDEVSPSPLPGLDELGLTAILLGGACAIAARSRGLPRVTRPKRVLIVLWAAVLFVLPAILLALTGGRLTSTTEVLAFALVPAAVVFTLAQSDSGQTMRLLVPALAGTAGAAIILPFTMPSSTAGRIALASVVVCSVLVAYASVRLHVLLAGVRMMQALTLCSAGAALVGALSWCLHSPPVPLLTRQQFLLGLSAHLLFTALTLWLSVWLLRTVDPLAFSTRFLLAPLVTIVEGFLLLRPDAPWTLAAGLLLLGGASILLIRGDEHQA